MNTVLTATESNRYKKTALTWARELTPRDYAETNGTIYTLEGPARFQAGDFLCRGVKGELWPVTRERFLYTKQLAGPVEADGFAPYRTTGEVVAVPSMWDFTVEIGGGEYLSGKAGDYLVQSGDHQWIVDKTIFEATYERVEETPKPKRTRRAKKSQADSKTASDIATDAVIDAGR
jgi:hypothetical protein